tara:strand:+ start:2038 stop:2721 length:684 start_codon:yes stop_codon:yes gene_type:complete
MKQVSVIKYLKEKNQNNFSISGIEIRIKDEIKNFSVKEAITKSFALLPDVLYSNIRSINIGQFKQLNDRDLNALYTNKNIYITNNQNSISDFMDDLIHEIAHLVDEEYNSLIYSDNRIKEEFSLKRKKMWSILKNRGFELDLKYFLMLQYNKEFDKFLYLNIGYPALGVMTSNIFYSPYAATSLKEYFANAFEGFFFHKDVDKIKKISPEIYKKLVILNNIQKRGIK